MAYMDFPFPNECMSFPTHKQVNDYLHEYAKAYDIMRLIKFRCQVLSVRLAIDSPGEEEETNPLSKWEVVYREKSDEENPGITKTEIFDAVCVANGHFDVESIPPTKGFEGFCGYSMHARAYDNPDVEQFIGKRVLCVGASYSGADVAREVSAVGKCFWSAECTFFFVAPCIMQSIVQVGNHDTPSLLLERSYCRVLCPYGQFGPLEGTSILSHSHLNLGCDFNVRNYAVYVTRLAGSSHVRCSPDW